MYNEYFLFAEQINRNSSSKNPGPISDGSRMDCSKITMQIFQVLLQNPDTVEPEGNDKLYETT